MKFLTRPTPNHPPTLLRLASISRLASLPIPLPQGKCPLSIWLSQTRQIFSTSVMRSLGGSVTLTRILRRSTTSSLTMPRIMHHHHQQTQFHDYMKFRTTSPISQAFRVTVFHATIKGPRQPSKSSRVLISWRPRKSPMVPVCSTSFSPGTMGPSNAWRAFPP